jgi:sugar phosphate permease
VRRAAQPPASAGQLFLVFRPPYLWLTLKTALMVAGAQGGVFAVQFWMPTYLRTVKGLSSTGTGGYVAVQMIGALIGFLIGAYLADAIGRKWTFFISAVSTVVMVIVYMYLPVSNEWLLWLGIPLSMSILMKFSPMGPFMTELYPTALRGTGQGFCYNGGRAIGSFFPTMVGFASQIMPLGQAIVLFACLASGLMIVMLPFLPETRGRSVATSEPAIGAAND